MSELPINPPRWALLCVAVLMLGLIWQGVAWLDTPPIYQQTHNSALLYRGYAIIALAIALAVFHHWVACKMLWLAEKLHRWMSAIMMMGVVMIDGSMHLFNIPHIEGWWLPFLSSGAMLSLMVGWWHRPKAPPRTPNE